MNRQGGLETDTKYCIGSRLGRLLFQLVVDVGMMGRIIASDTAMDNETIERLRAECARDAKKANGQISFRNALRFCDLLP